MELDDHDLRLIDPDSLAVLHTQPIHQIRVWGVGRDNGRYARVYLFIIVLYSLTQMSYAHFVLLLKGKVCMNI